MQEFNVSPFISFIFPPPFTQDVQVNNEFISILNAIKPDRPDLNVYHGGLGGAPQKAAERPKPMKVRFFLYFV